MSTKSTYSLFQDLEKSLRSLVGTEDGSDYNKLTSYLGLAKDVHDLGEQFRNVSGLSSEKQNVSSQGKPVASRQAAVTAHTTMQNAHRFVIAPGSPIYFIHNDELIKIGSTNSEDGALYKKSVSLSEVDMVCRPLCQLLSTSPVVSVSEIKEAMGPSFPLYKVQTVLLALVASGGLKQTGRGKYSSGADVRDELSPDSLVASLRLLPVNDQALARVDNHFRRRNSGFIH